jgi:cell wall-associated NlpC family hydrolase
MAAELRASANDHVDDADAAPLFSATVCTAVAPMHGEPKVASQMVSQQLAGHHVDVVDEDGEWLRARGDDGYEGWMHRGFLARTPHDGARQSRRPARVSLGCVTRTGAGDRRALPLRAILSSDETVSDGEAVDAVALRDRFPLDAASIARVARDYFAGTSYLWGGVTPWGADCSGLTQCVFALHGMTLPRDAWQQAELGRDAGRDLAAFRAADLLFFSDRADRRVTHVGVALGERGMVHLALTRGGYAIERLDDASDPYVAKLRERFLFGRRLIEP